MGGTFSTALGLRRFSRTSVRKSLEKSSVRIDLLHCHDADTLPLVHSTEAKILFDMHDLHHTWALMPNPKSPIRKIASKQMERAMIRRAMKADAVITSSEGFANWLSSNKISATVIENRPQRQTKLPLPATPTIGYFGRIREISSFQLLVAAMRQIPTDSRPRLLIAGTVPTYMEFMVSRIIYRSQLEIRGPLIIQISSMMSEINLMFAMYSPDENINDGALPSKIFKTAAMAALVWLIQTPQWRSCVNQKISGSL